MDLLCQLQAIPGPSGDEGRIAEFVQRHCEGVPGTRVRNIHDLILAVRGKPKVAVFAHTDTIGFTQCYDRKLARLGGPRVEGGELIREVGTDVTARITVKQKGERPDWLLPKKVGKRGSRWVFADPLKIKKDRIRGPYLDNRAGVWNGLRVLERCEDVAVVFSPNEEATGRGAFLGARLVYEDLKIEQALISDITWHTDSIKCGKGPAISYRDRMAPRQAFLDRVLAAAEGSGIPFQHELETDGGSDGHSLERSGYPVDWVFIGAPEKRCHTPREECRISDLDAMVELYVHLIGALSGAGK
jgi:putative aminopeptidase FrvX